MVYISQKVTPRIGESGSRYLIYNKLQNFISQKVIKLFEPNFQIVFLYAYTASSANLSSLALLQQKNFCKLAGHLVFNSGSNESSLAPQFKWLDNTFKLLSLSPIFFFLASLKPCSELNGVFATIKFGSKSFITF